MNNKIKIPKGWRKLKVGEVIKVGDKAYYHYYKSFIDCHFTVGMKVIRREQSKFPFIRKIKSPKPKIIIPDGYEKLANGTIIKKGDLFYHPHEKQWYDSMAIGFKVIGTFAYARKVGK